jgi:hypothetical protein
VKEENTDGQESETEITFKRFVFRRNWFMLSQTDGAEFRMPAIPAWDRARALQTLNVEEIPFEMLNGNCQGYAKGRQIAINPVAQMSNYESLPEIATSYCEVKAVFLAQAKIGALSLYFQIRRVYIASQISNKHHHSLPDQPDSDTSHKEPP